MRAPAGLPALAQLLIDSLADEAAVPAGGRLPGFFDVGAVGDVSADLAQLALGYAAFGQVLGPGGRFGVGLPGGAPNRPQGPAVRGEAARDDEEPGVGHHPVVGPDRQALQVPGPHEGLAGLGLGVRLALAQALDEPGHLGRRGDVGEDDPARPQGVRAHADELPGGEHVEDDAVEFALPHGRQHVRGLPHLHRPRKVRPRQPRADVPLRYLGELGAALAGDEAPFRSDRRQQREREGPRSQPRLEDPGAGVDVGYVDDLRRVLRVDDGRPPGHGQDVVGDEGAQSQEAPAVLGLQDRALLGADELGVAEGAPSRLEVAVARERDRVLAALGIRQLDAVAGAEGPSAGRGGMVAHGRPLYVRGRRRPSEPPEARCTVVP